MNEKTPNTDYAIDTTFRRMLGLIQTLELHSKKFKDIIIVCESLSIGGLVIEIISPWLDKYSYNYTLVTTTNHMEGIKPMDSIVILYDRWFNNRKIRKDVFDLLIDNKRVPCFPISYVPVKGVSE